MKYVCVMPFVYRRNSWSDGLYNLGTVFEYCGKSEEGLYRFRTVTGEEVQLSETEFRHCLVEAQFGGEFTVIFD